MHWPQRLRASACVPNAPTHLLRFLAPLTSPTRTALHPLRRSSVAGHALLTRFTRPHIAPLAVVKTDNPLAITYNDQSPLENMHCATAFGIMQDRRSNILGGIPRSSHDTVREAIISMVRKVSDVVVVERRMAEAEAV